MPEIDFEGTQQTTPQQGGNAGNNPNANENNNPATQEETTHLNGGGTEDITGKNNEPASNNQNEENNGENQNQIPHDIEEGTEVEYDGVVYKINDKGDLVNDKGEVFKEAKDVKKWLEDNDVTDSNEAAEISIDSIKETFGVDITDENGKNVEFTNDAAGIKAYVDAVFELKSNEIQQGAINKLYSDNPLLKQFVDYVTIKGTPKGFGDIPDRSKIELDKDNDAQLEAVIRMAAQEFGNKSLNENYIKYLKSTGSLYDEAKAQLEALIAKDNQTRKDIEEKAAAARAQEQADVEAYFNNVNKAIKERRIGGYLLPETIVKEVNGQKITYKLDDFYAYVSKATEADANGNRMTGYSRDLNKLSDKELLERELLDAWLLWTGGTYKDLVDMAIKEEGVHRLVAKSKENRTQRRIKINKPAQSGDKTKLVFE